MLTVTHVEKSVERYLHAGLICKFQDTVHLQFLAEDIKEIIGLVFLSIFPFPVYDPEPPKTSDGFAVSYYECNGEKIFSEEKITAAHSSGQVVDFVTLVFHVAHIETRPFSWEGK
jgi:hypothetical protein